jgi:phosphoglycolate phosphatase
MTIKAVLFDLDGTLLDTVEDIADATNRVLEQNEFPLHPLDAYRYFVGEGAAKLMERAAPPDQRNRQTIERLVEEFLVDYGRNSNVKTQPYPGIPELLDELTRRGVRMAVLSNKPHQATVECVNALLANWHFEWVFGQREGIPRKPDPAGAVEIAELMALDIAEFLFMGDTAIDMQTAVAAGMLPIGALWGFRPEELRQGGTGELIAEPVEFLNFLGA